MSFARTSLWEQAIQREQQLLLGRTLRKWSVNAFDKVLVFQDFNSISMWPKVVHNGYIESEKNGNRFQLCVWNWKIKFRLYSIVEILLSSWTEMGEVKLTEKMYHWLLKKKVWLSIAIQTHHRLFLHILVINQPLYPPLCLGALTKSAFYGCLSLVIGFVRLLRRGW